MRYVILLTLVLAVAPAAYAVRIKTTEDLIRTMQKKYGKSWYRNATFVQKTTDFEPDGTTKVSIWYEALSVPGFLRIDFAPLKDGNGILFTKGMIYSFKNGKMQNSGPFIHPLMILGFDIYKIPLNEAVNTLKDLKFDLSILREDTWQGRPVYVVGAKRGDLRSPQFWIDKQNLYFVRMLRPGRKDASQIEETQFNKYQRLGGGWMAPEVIFMIDGKTVTTEEYSDLRSNVPLDNKLFDPQHWTTTDHWKKEK
jgi:hypothetical protein